MGFSSLSMKIFSSVLLVVSLDVAKLRVEAGDQDGKPVEEVRLANAFESYISSFGKAYASLEEKAKRFGAFSANLKFIEESNARGDRSYVLGLNKFADMTKAEFAEAYLGFRAEKKDVVANPFGDAKFLGTVRSTGKAVPEAWNWTAQGAVTPVKDQAHCGSCWAFSSTGALEGAWQRKTGTLLSLSEQQFVDCSWSFTGDHGCMGGRQKYAFDYAEKNDICTEASYPYLGVFEIMQKCAATNCTTGIKKGQLAGYKNVEGSEDAIKEALATLGPLAIAIESDQQVFQLYQSGVLTGEACGEDLDHAVLLTGYGVDEKGKTYWVVKNSWGGDWGEAGYVRLARGSDECGIAQMPPLFPVLQNSTAVAQEAQDASDVVLV